MKWYYEVRGQPQGPVTDSELDELVADGTVRDQTRLWREGMEDWLALSEIRPAHENVDELRSPDHAERSTWQDTEGTERRAPGTDEERIGLPWEQHAKPSPRSAIATAVMVLSRPRIAFDSMRLGGGYAIPTLYSVAIGTAAVLAATGIDSCLQSIIPEAARDAGETARSAGPEALMSSLLLAPALLAAATFIQSGLLHLCLILVNQERLSMERTFRVCSYVGGSITATFPALYAILIINQPLGTTLICASALWNLAILCIGLSKSHGIGAGRTLCGILLPAVFCIMAETLLRLLAR